MQDYWLVAQDRANPKEITYFLFFIFYLIFSISICHLAAFVYRIVAPEIANDK
jgi:hypothetical protein